MAGVIQNVQVFDGYVREFTSEQIAQDINAFNSASAGTIQLAGLTPGGDFELSSFVKDIRSDGQYRRDPSSTASVTPTAYQEGRNVSVKIGGGFGPITIPDAVLAWAGNGEPNAEVAQALNQIAIQYSEAFLQDQLNTLIKGGVAAIENNTDVTSDVSEDTGNGGTATTITQARLNTAYALFGDRSNMLMANIMHSNAYHGLIGQALASTASIYEIGGIAVKEGTVYGQGRPIVVTDSPALIETVSSAGVGTYDVVKTLALAPSALVATQAKDNMASEKITGAQNIYTQWQANYSFMASVKGYAWDITNGGSFPTDAEVATGTNWDKVVTNNKNTAGVMLVTNAQ